MDPVLAGFPDIYPELRTNGHITDLVRIIGSMETCKTLVEFITYRFQFTTKITGRYLSTFCQDFSNFDGNPIPEAFKPDYTSYLYTLPD